MPLYEREKKYINLLGEGTVSVKELALKLFISEPTVRRDITALEKKDLVVCKRGNVSLKVKYADQRIPLFIRDMEQNDEKRVIAQKAVEYIKDGDTVMLDASTTVFHMLPYIAEFKNILVITNGAKTALELAAMGIKTLCTGGELTSESFSYVGTDAESILNRYNADVAFFSCRGLTMDGLVTDNSILENSMRKIMIKNSKKSYLLCDSSKHGKTYLNTICRADELEKVISEK